MSLVSVLIIFMAIIIIYLALISVFSILFQITGLPRSKAFFQTISLLTAVGFTTSESEMIATHPARRKLAITLMIIGSLLSVVVISLLVDSISSFDPKVIVESEQILIVAFTIFLAVIFVFNLPFVRKPLEKALQRIGENYYNKKTGGNIITILDNYGEDSIAEIKIKKLPEVLQNKTLFESKIKDQYSINVMIITRRDLVVNLTKDTIVQEGDQVVVFGNKMNIHSLFGNFSQEEQKEEQPTIKNKIFVLENYGEKCMAEIDLHIMPECLKEKTLFESDIRKQHDINVMVIKRNNKVIDIRPKVVLEEKDTIIVFGKYRDIKFIFDLEEKIEA